MNKMYNSHCIVCKKPAMAPKGNFNANRATLCLSAKCRRRRKTQLQQVRRMQRELKLGLKPTDRQAPPSSRKKTPKQRVVAVT
jgi:predicted nucleic acid-binding Zn ribbon protein